MTVHTQKSGFSVIIVSLAAVLFAEVLLNGCYSFKSRYRSEDHIIESRKCSWALPSDIAPEIIQKVILHWDSGHRMTRLERQRTAVAISGKLKKHGYARWFCYRKWIEIYVHQENPDRLISKHEDRGEGVSDVFDLNLIEHR